MQYRCPTATVVGPAELEGYDLLFRGSRHSAVATVEPLEGELEKCVDKLCEKHVPKDVRELFEMRRQEQAGRPSRPPRPRASARQEPLGDENRRE